MAVCRATGAPCEVINEIRYGGATYVSTGRGLPTDRRPFIGEAVPGKLLIIANDECCTQFIIFCFTHLRSWTTPKPWNPGKRRSNEFEPCWGFSSKSLEGFTSITHPLHTTQLDQKKKRVTGLYRKRKWLSVAVSGCPSEQKGMKSKEWHWSSGRWGWRYSSCWSSPYLLGRRCFRQEVLGFCQLRCSQDFAVHASCFQSLLSFVHQLSDQLFNQPTGGAGVFSNDVWWVFICLFLTVASWLWVPSMQVVQVQPGPTIQLSIRIDSQPQTMNSLKLSQAQILTTSKYAITILRILI